MAFLGPVGTFSEQAALQFFGSSIERSPASASTRCFEPPQAGTAEFGVVPVENSDRRASFRVRSICSCSRRCTWWAKPACWCAITTCCARHPASLDGIEVVLAHPQALAQCQGPAQHAPARCRAPRGLQQRRGARLAAQHRTGPARQRPRAASESACTSRPTPSRTTRLTAPALRWICSLQTLPAPQASGQDCVSLIVSVPNRPVRCTTCWCR